MLKRLLGVCTLALLVATGLPSAASAHELRVDGSIAAILHTNPDDNPVTGSPTSYFFEFSSDGGKFNLHNCLCNVSILEAGHTIATWPLAATTNVTSDGSYEFPRPGVYTVRVTGAPKQPGAFQSFVLNYEETIGSGKPTPQPMPGWAWAGIGLSIALILLVSYITNRKV